MSYDLNPILRAVAASPVAEAQSWVQGRVFPAEKPLLDIAQAVPGYPPAPALLAHLAEQLGRANMAHYTGNFGLPALREVLAAHLSNAYGGTIPAQQVGITSGCNQAFCVAVSALAAPGDEVMLPLPYYFNHQMWLEMQGIRVLHLPCSRHSIPDPEIAARLITPRTRAIVLITPNNPTGAIYPPAILKAFYDLAQQHDLALILDETYKDFLIADSPPHDLFQQPDWSQTLVQLYSFSKAYSLTGYRVGAITASIELLEQIAKIIDCVTICPPRIGQEAALYGLNHLADWVADKRQLMQTRMIALENAFQHPKLRYQMVSAGAYFAYVRHPFGGESAVARRLLDQQHILCLPGSDFGPQQDEYLRFAFANLEADQMPELVARLVASQS